MGNRIGVIYFFRNAFGIERVCACLPSKLDSHHFAYRANRSTEAAITIALHAALSHLEQPGSYIRMPIIDHSSASNNSIPLVLVYKLTDLDLPPVPGSRSF